MEEYKKRYNLLLQRYYNGCKFLAEHPEQENKYLQLLLNILNDLNIILVENNITDENIILNGF